jgi:hypothetical protein
MKPGWRGDACQSDPDCGWHLCAPARCEAHPEPNECDRGGPPGTCTCVEHQCTLHRDVAPAPVPGCAADADCAVDVGTATCHLHGKTSIGPIEREGPVCACVQGACQLQWDGPVACSTWKDCSWTRQPRLRPVPAKLVPRPVDHPVKPCSDDGEIDSVCAPDKTCRIISSSC